MKILVTTDGSACALKAVEFLASHAAWFSQPLDVYLFHVGLKVPATLAATQAEQLVGASAIDLYYKQAASEALFPAEEILEKHGITYQRDFKIGNVVDEIKAYAKEKGADLIIMGSHGHGMVKNIVLGSVVTKVLALTTIPVLVVR